MSELFIFNWELNCLTLWSFNHTIKTFIVKERNCIFFCLNQSNNIFRCFECYSSIWFLFICLDHRLWLLILLLNSRRQRVGSFLFWRFCRWLLWNRIIASWSSIGLDLTRFLQIFNTYGCLVRFSVLWRWFRGQRLWFWRMRSLDWQF